MSAPAALAEILPPERHDPLPPMAVTVLIGPDGRGWIPHAHRAGIFVDREVTIGLGLAWAPLPEIGRLLLCLAGGNPSDPSDEALTVLLSACGLRAVIADLQSIVDQLGDNWPGDLA